MKKRTTSRHQNIRSIGSALILVLACLFITGFSPDYLAKGGWANQMDPDINGDGSIHILVLGTNSSIDGGKGFSPDQIATELENILDADASLGVPVNVVAEDIHLTRTVTVGLGQGGTEYDWIHHSHSLIQYYYWPDGREARMANLNGTGGIDWDYVVIASDPYILSAIPGYFALGVNKIAAKVAEGGGVPLLLMMWPENESSGASIAHFEEFTYRTADGSKVELSVIPAGLAWEALPVGKKDVSGSHPSPNGAYLAAASMYAHIRGENATASDYIYDDELADMAYMTVEQEGGPGGDRSGGRNCKRSGAALPGHRAALFPDGMPGRATLEIAQSRKICASATGEWNGQRDLSPGMFPGRIWPGWYPRRPGRLPPAGGTQGDSPVR